MPRTRVLSERWLKGQESDTGRGLWRAVFQCLTSQIMHMMDCNNGAVFLLLQIDQSHCSLSYISELARLWCLSRRCLTFDSCHVAGRVSGTCKFMRRVALLFSLNSPLPPLCLILTLLPPLPPTSNKYLIMPWKRTKDARRRIFSRTHSLPNSRTANRPAAFSTCFNSKSRTSISLNAEMKAGRGG